MKIKIKILLSFIIFIGGFTLIASDVLAQNNGSGCASQGGTCIYAECPAGKAPSSNNDCQSWQGVQFYCCVSSSPTANPSPTTTTNSDLVAPCTENGVKIPDGTTCYTNNIMGTCQRGACIYIPGASPGSNFGTGGAGAGPPSTFGNKPKCVSPMVEGPGGVCYPGGTNLPDPSGGVKQVIVNLLYWLLGIFGFIAIIGFVISGIQYVTSAGSERAIDAAKRNMKYCILGVVVALAGVIIITAINMALNAGGFF